MSTVRERRRAACSIVATLRISEEISERIDDEVARQLAELPLDAARADRVVSRASVMREALERGLEGLERGST